jgi:hypothetical protein
MYNMRTTDRCILGIIALGVWALVGTLLLAPQPASSQSASMNGLIDIAAQQISRLDCRFNGTKASGGNIVGDIRCHL